MGDGLDFQIRDLIGPGSGGDGQQVIAFVLLSLRIKVATNLGQE